MKCKLILLFYMLGAASFASCDSIPIEAEGSATDDDTETIIEDNTAAEESKIITVSGTLTLDSTLTDISDSGLSPGDSVEGAQVFLKGFPNKVTTSDSAGTFSLEIDLNDEEFAALADSDADPIEHTVLMWKESNNYLFGTSEKFTPDSEGESEVGNVSLTYTNAIHFHVSDDSTSELITSDCKVEVLGFGDKIPTKKISAGKYDSEYMPADDYVFEFTCTGFNKKSFTFTVPTATKTNSWVTHKFSVVPSED